jgi:hypothetical protein
MIVQTVDTGGNVVPVNITVSSSASRTLGSSERGMPSTFSVVNGSYTNGNILLNRARDRRSRV